MANTHDVIECVCYRSVCGDVVANDVGVFGSVEKPGFKHHVALCTNNVGFVDVKCDCDIR